MTHQGRVHLISSKAEESSRRILSGVPREKLVYGTGVRRPVWIRIEFPETREERKLLAEAARIYDSHVSIDDHLIVHGTQDCPTLCQILHDGELRHIKTIENYGSLECTSEVNVTEGGFWDRGWGIFVTNSRTIDRNRGLSRDKDFLVVPISDLTAIVLPSEVVDLVRAEFSNIPILKGYRQFAYELLS